MELRSSVRRVTTLASVLTILSCGNREVGSEPGSGALIVAVLAGTGVVAVIGLAGETALPQLFGAPWAWLIAAKLLLFAGTLGLAWRHRTRLVPAYEAGRHGAAVRLRASLAAELMLLLGIFALVAFAGQLDPAGG